MTRRLDRDLKEISGMTLKGMKDALALSRFWLRMKWNVYTEYELHRRLLRHAALLERVERQAGGRN